MTIFPAFVADARQALSRFHAWRANVRTRRIVSGLPHYIRKDIGWPDTSLPERPDRRWQ